MSLPTTMKEAHVDVDTNVSIHDVSVPKISHPSQMIVKVIVTGCNPKDWKMPAGILKTIANRPNSGDDIAGIVAAVGDDVQDFKVGDRVAALHELGSAHGSFAEYALVWEHTTFKLGKNTSFEEAATVPMISLMASIGLFGMLQVTSGPWTPLRKEQPLLVYGAASAVGSMAVKLAQIANVHPVIAVAGNGVPFVETLIDKEKGDTVIDYRAGPEAVVEGVKAALEDNKLFYAFDAVSEKDSFNNTAQVLHPEGGKVSFVLPQRRKEFGPNVEQTNTMAGCLWKQLKSISGDDIGDLGTNLNGQQFGHVFSRVIGRMLDSGDLKPHPYEVLKGMKNIETALKNLRFGKTSAQKYVVRIAEDDGSVIV